MLGSRILTFSLLLMLILGCKQKDLNAKDYLRFIKSEDSNLYKIREVGDFKFEVLYQPIEYKIALQMKNSKNDKIQFEKLKTEMQGMQYYTLKISPINGNKSILKYNLQSEEDYQARLAYFSFGMQEDVFIEQEDNKIDCSLYHFERAYDLSNYRVFDLAFEDNISEDKTLVIRSDFFGTGPIKFKFKQSDIENLPNLILD